MEVFFSELATTKLEELTQYLIENWGIGAKDKFVRKLSDKVIQIQAHPESCQKSNVAKNLYKCVVTKQTTLYYRINNSTHEIEVATIFDTRQHLNQLNKEIK